MKQRDNPVFSFYNALRQLQTLGCWKFCFGSHLGKQGYFAAAQQKIRKDFVRLALLIS
ncbi:Unknown protein sequence [Pseudomonas syringae pv. cilantro]|uniref:Uncharacterized protein n=1 Tax=Pseudomonas syringae pv. cilantro TaxID=81035 RepID=A0A0N0X9R1_PSESX|nr:Unknown protein sequence [Pseudomonas syringae pv. cilantro]